MPLADLLELVVERIGGLAPGLSEVRGTAGPAESATDK